MNIFYFIFEAILEIVKHPLSFILSLFVFVIPIYFLGASFFLYREGGIILRQEKERYGDFLIEADKRADIQFLKEQIKSIKEIKGLKDVTNAESGKIIFQADLNVNLDETLKIEETKRTIFGLNGVRFVKYQGDDIEFLERKNLILSGFCLFLGILSSIFAVKYISYRFRKESQINNKRIKILELAGAPVFFIYSVFMAKGLLAGLISGFLTIMLLMISLEKWFLNNHLRFFVYPSTLFIIAACSLFLINVNYYLTVKKEIRKQQNYIIM